MLRRTITNGCTPKTDYARRLRRAMTPGEILFWERVRNKNFYELKFRRQAPIGPYIVDFLCIEKMVIVEIDGSSHDNEDQFDKDQERQKYLEQEGFRIIRFREEDMKNDMFSVMRRLEFFLGLTDS